jgi:lipopolysaccharide/colanic/teichoic acid biosynthesis glycosyltransferase
MTQNAAPRTNASFDLALKRGFDALGAALLLLVFSPVLLVVAILVKLSSPGPVLFRQQRVGKNGHLFWIYKFRSMSVNNVGPSVTSGTDSRITPIGRFLRKFKFDELPQLFNVFKGDMSLVGPRPEVQKYVDHYTEAEREALSVPPGITGLTQLEYRDEEKLLAGREDVERFYIDVVMRQKLEIDLRYVRTRTFWGDFKILLQTLVAIVR